LTLEHARHPRQLTSADDIPRISEAAFRLAGEVLGASSGGVDGYRSQHCDALRAAGPVATVD
jgi:hypothetical protein